MRKLALHCLAALLTCAALASTATAVEVQDATTSTALAVGDTFNGQQTTSSTLAGSTFGVSWSVRCVQATFVATLTANAPAPAAGLTSLGWAMCVSNTGNPCSMLALNLPWTGALSFPTATQMSWTIPSNGGWQVGGSQCLPLGVTCTFGASQTLSFAWANVIGGAGTATGNQTVSSSTCGNATWTSAYAVRRGSTIGSGNGVQVV